MLGLTMCHVGIHRPVYTDAYRPTITTLTGWEWLKVRKCVKCGKSLPR